MTALVASSRPGGASGGALLDRTPAALAVEVPDLRIAGALSAFLRQHELTGEHVVRGGRILVDVRYPFEQTDVPASELTGVLAVFQRDNDLPELEIWVGSQRHGGRRRAHGRAVSPTGERRRP